MKKVFLFLLAVFFLGSSTAFSDDHYGRPPASEEIKDINPGTMHGSTSSNPPKTEPAKPKPAESVKPKPAEPVNPPKPSESGDYGRPKGDDASPDQNDGTYHVVLSNYLGKDLPAQETVKPPVPGPAQDPPKAVTTPVADDGQAMKASFSEASGLDMEQESVDYRTGSEDITTRKAPDLKNPTINQKRAPAGFKASDALKGGVGQAPNARSMDGMKEEVASAEMRD